MAKRRTRSTSRSKPTQTNTPATAAKPAVGLTVVSSEEPAQSAAPEPSVVLKKKEFFERVVARSGAKKSEVRTIAEAVLEEIGEALSKGEVLALPPLGKVRVTRSVDRDSAEMIVAKIRRPKAGAGASDAGDDDASDTDMDEGDDE